jgi:hypothetical protein
LSIELKNIHNNTNKMITSFAYALDLGPRTPRFGARGVVQAVECLVCKDKALSSNPSPTRKKNPKIHTPRFEF